jgi:hypothetical protein
MNKLQEVDQHGKRCKGKKELIKHLEGKPLSAKQSIAAKCYDCMGYGETDVNGSRDCQVPYCSLYPYMPYNDNKRVLKRVISEEKRKEMGNRLRKVFKAVMVLLMLSLPSILNAQDREYTIRPLYPDTSRPPGSAGTYTNPYTITPRHDGNMEVKPLYPDYRQKMGEPGSYTNPYIIEKR